MLSPLRADYLAKFGNKTDIDPAHDKAEYSHNILTLS